jgi:DNA-binding transcriptional MerR regulator
MPGIAIGKLAKLANVSIDTIRFYEKAGLLSPNVRRPSGFRQYSDVDLRQLRFIRRGRQLGFSLEEIRALLALEPATAADSSVVVQQMRVIDRKIEDLTKWRRSLLQLSAASKPAPILDYFPDEVDGPDSSEVIRDFDERD